MATASSNASDAVETVVDLLETADTSTWTHADPSVEHYWDATQQTKLNRPDPYLYAYSPANGNYRRIDGDYSVVDEQQTVAVEAWVMEDVSLPQDGADRANQYASDAFSFLSDYGNDNENRTNFYRIQPQEIDDRKAEHTVRETDHFVVSLTVVLDKFTSTGV